MPDILWLIAIGLIVSGVVSATRRARARTTRQRWTEAAEQLGFAMVGSGYRGISMASTDGQLRAIVEVYNPKQSGWSSSTSTRYRVEYPSLGLGLRLSKEGTLHGILKTLGGQDLEIGHDQFDDTFFVKAHNEERVRRYLNAERIANLADLVEHYPGVVVTDDEIRLETSGMTQDVEQLVSTVNRLMAAGRVLAPSEPILADEPEPSSEREAELQRVFETITAEGLPDEAGSTGTTDRADPDVAPAADSDALLVATRLFGEHQLGFEIERLFAAEFEGRSVDWSGTVRRPAGLMATRAFDDESREVVVIEVASLDDELYGTTSIDAIVAFAGGAAPQPGETVRFTGRLIDVDGVSKDLYVADAELN